MSFDAQQLALISDGVGGGALNIFSYRTEEDTLSDTLVEGYFVNGSGYGLHVGDLVIVKTDASAELAEVVLVDDDGDATIALVQDSQWGLSTKSPVVDWEDREILWLGTSIPHEGGNVNSYPLLVADILEANVSNMAWAGSIARYSAANDAFDVTTIKRLSMTQDDVDAGLAAHGTSSAYDDSFDVINKASEMTADHRIKAEFEATPEISVVILDHNHNDRGGTVGTLTPERLTITGISKGATTQITLSSIGTIAVGDAVALEVTGISHLNYAAARVQAVSGNTITLNIDSSAFSGSFTSGQAVKLDRNTVYGAWEFLICYIKNCSIRFGDGNVKIVLCGAPSNYTGDAFDARIASNARYIKDVQEKWEDLGVGFFDIAHSLGITEQTHVAYFPDEIHPTTLASRQVIARHWVQWLLGGTTEAHDIDNFLPSGGETEHLDQYWAMYSRFINGFGTASRFIGATTPYLTEDFSAGLGAWTTSGDAPTVGAAPWDAGEFAVNCHATLPETTSYIEHAATPGDGRVVEFDFWLPEVSGLNASELPATVGLFHFRSTGAYYVASLLVRQDSTQLRFQHFETPNVTLNTLAPDPQLTLERQTKYNIRCEMYKGSSATDQGRMIVYLNDELVGGPYKVNDWGQTALATIRIGIVGSNTGANFQMYFGNVVLSDLAVHSLTARKTLENTATAAGDELSLVNGIVTAFSPALKTPTVLSNDGNNTLTAAQFRTGIIEHSGMTADRTDTTPTAAQLVANRPGAVVGTSYEVIFANTDDSHNMIIGAGAGVTLKGQATIAPGKTAKSLVVFTNVTAASEAVTIYICGAV